MAAMLNVAQQTISDRLKAMGKIQIQDDRQMENRKNTCEILLQRHERKSVLHRITANYQFEICIDRKTIRMGQKTQSISKYATQ